MSEGDAFLPETRIRKFEFSDDGIRDIPHMPKGIDWPVVYILTGEDSNKRDVAYVGETSSAFIRITQHLANPARKGMKLTYIIVNEMFNKSAVLDIENALIEHMHVDGSFLLQNLNRGQSKFHNYYQRLLYRQIFIEVWEKLGEEHLARRSLNDIENSNLFKYSPFKQLTEEQYELRNRLLLDISSAFENGIKKEIIVEGGAGTGKSVLAVSLLKYIGDIFYQSRDCGISVPEGETIEDADFDILQRIRVNRELSRKTKLDIAFVIPMDAFRKTVRNVFSATPSLKALNVDVVGPGDLTRKKGGYDIVIVDEAHRLQSYARCANHAAYMASCSRLGFDDPMEATQLDWVIRQSKSVLIMFYDSRQSISAKDIPSQAFDKVMEGGAVRYTISNQIRLLAGKEYIDFWVDLLLNRKLTGSINISANGYDFRIYNRFSDMMADIKKRNDENDGLCRVLSGYGFRCSQIQNAGRKEKDIVIDGESYYWNDRDDVDWVNNPLSSGDIGCVHRVQGFDLNYAGVVFAPDICYDEEKGILPVREKFYDRMAKSSVKGKTEADILNSYLVLLTRGIKGTYIYCCDKKLREYLTRIIGSVYVREQREE